MIDKCNAATPSGDLLRDLMDSNIPKSEREWFAARKIKEQDAEIAALKAELGNSEAVRRGLEAEVERLKELENKMGSGWALVEYEKMQSRLEQAEARVEKVRKYLKKRGMEVTPGYYGVPLIHEDVLDDLEEILK